MTEEPEQREYAYCGPEEQPQRAVDQGKSVALSPEAAEKVFRSAWTRGRYHLSPQFKERCTDRTVDLVDVENLIRDGRVRAHPEYDSKRRNWKYRLGGTVDERHVEIVIALDPAEDYTGSPLAIFVTAYVHGPNP